MDDNVRNHLYIFIQTLKYSRQILVHQIKSDAKKPPEIHENQIDLLMDVVCNTFQTIKPFSLKFRRSKNIRSLAQNLFFDSKCEVD